MSRTSLKILCMLVGLALASVAAEGASMPNTQWSGFYAGAAFGWPRSRIDYREPDLPGYQIAPDINGFQGGVTAGYNDQIDRYVIGLAIDGGLDTSRLDSDDPDGNGYSAIDFDWYAHLRARVGYTLPRRTLVFATFGLALAHMTIDDVDPGFGKDRALLKGWTVGAGLEHQAGDHLILSLEYVYDNYGKASFTITAPASSAFFPLYQADTDVTARSVRATIAWHF